MRESSVQFYNELPGAADLHEDVVRGLSVRPRRLPPKYFYDRRGSELFDAICRVPEYYITRTEMTILQHNAFALTQLTDMRCTLIELGSGASRKVRFILDTIKPYAYIGVDISKEFLLQSTRRLAIDYPWLKVYAVYADFCQPLTLMCCPSGYKRVAFFPGSSIGNFEPHDAEVFLSGLTSMLGPEGGALLIGVDLKKCPILLNAAYNDAQGITAEFNLNLLRRMQRELGVQVDTSSFCHEAFYNEAQGRIEMYLISQRQQHIRLGNNVFHFEAGERLHTENSYKYSMEEFQSLAQRAGYEPAAVWTDERNLFSVHYLRVK